MKTCKTRSMNLSYSCWKSSPPTLPPVSVSYCTCADDEFRVLEQPFKIPFVAAIVVVANTQKPEVTQEILARAGGLAQKYLDAGAWMEFKLVLRFLGLLQGLFEGEGIFPILEDLFSRAVDLQTASSEDVRVSSSS